MPSKNLTKDTYQKLLKDITGIYDEAFRDLQAALDSILKKAHWQIGKRIVETEQKGKLHANYGSHLLEDISRDLTRMNRKGFSVSNLKNMRQVYSAFSIRQLTGELTWTHYVALSAIQDKKEREAYLKKATEKKWNVQDLKNILSRDQVKTITLQEHSPKMLPGKPVSKAPRIIRLAVKRGILNTYRVLDSREKNLGDDEDDHKHVWLDLGFRIYKRMDLLLKDAGVSPGDIVRVSDIDKGFDLKKINPRDFDAGSLLFTYAASVVKVIDGDTITVYAPLGTTMLVKKKLRLRRINTPEVDTSQGKRVRNFVLEKMKDCSRQVVIKTYSTDIYDRYLVDIFYLPGREDPQKIALEGKLLNQELLDEGLAEIWRTPDPEELAFLN